MFISLVLLYFKFTHWKDVLVFFGPVEYIILQINQMTKLNKNTYKNMKALDTNNFFVS